jgi:hypothetical protein
VLKQQYSAIDQEANNDRSTTAIKWPVLVEIIRQKTMSISWHLSDENIMDNCHSTASACFAVFTRDSIEHLLQNNGVEATPAELDFMMVS